MSRFEWERGTIVLPSAAVPAVRAAVRAAANEYRAEVWAKVQEFWVGVARRTRSPKVFAARLHGWRPNGDSFAVEDAYSVLEHLAAAPRAPRRADLDRVAAPMNTRSTGYTSAEFEIVFDGRDVTWSVFENNYAVERAHDHPVAEAFFAALSKVTWTRGSGGELVGNDEYNRDARGAEEGGNYVTATYPPPPRPATTPVPAGRW